MTLLKEFINLSRHVEVFQQCDRTSLALVVCNKILNNALHLGYYIYL